MADVALRGVFKAYGNTHVIHDVSLDVGHGEFVVFVGPWGCGKSTLLRMIAGLEEVTGGDVLIGGNRVNDTAARDRGVAMVFQNYALYPHMSVRENMAFGLRNIGTPRTEVDQRIARAAEILQLDSYLERKPRAMSGGQRQRVAIGRAIVREPEVFLLDEPLSNLDANLRVQMRTEIARLYHRLGATMIYVTHDQTEAMTMADRTVVLRAGVIEQVGAPLDLCERPANIFVAGFLGAPKINFLEGRIARRLLGHRRQHPRPAPDAEQARRLQRDDHGLQRDVAHRRRAPGRPRRHAVRRRSDPAPQPLIPSSAGPGHVLEPAFPLPAS